MLKNLFNKYKNVEMKLTSDGTEKAIEMDETEYLKKMMESYRRQVKLAEYTNMTLGNPIDPNWINQAQNTLGNIGMATQSVKYPNRQKLLMRLNLTEGEKTPWKDMHIATNPAKQEVIIFFIYQDEPMFLRDGEALFPSDALIGKMNLMR